MSGPERIVIAGDLDECGSYYPSAVEAEGEHGGFAVEYIRLDLHEAAVAAAREREREIWVSAICTYFDATAVMDVENYADRIREEASE